MPTASNETQHAIYAARNGMKEYIAELQAAVTSASAHWRTARASGT
jgi:hypothetical protein